MAIATDKLLVLKAFHMGHAIAKKKSNVAQAVAMADAAISMLEHKKDQESRIRLLFYVLLKAEILRSTNDVAGLRQRAKDISKAIGSEIYHDYMAVEEATQTRVKANGIHNGVIENSGVRSTTTFEVTNSFNKYVEIIDPACRALGVKERSLSAKEFHFLHKVSLKEMLNKHGVPFAL